MEWFKGMKGGMVEVAGIEPAPPNGLQIYDIMRYNYTSKIANGTGVMGQLFK